MGWAPMNKHIKIRSLELRQTPPGLEQQLWVRVENVSITASVGIYAAEKENRQEILLNISAEVRNPEKDRINEAVDYRTLVGEARRLATEGHFELIETFICNLGQRLLGIERVNAVELELYKPAAIPPAMASVRYYARQRATRVVTESRRCDN
ncbi:MAG: dihydroneopterin aldolase [Rhodospirillaceae bacterium]|nr:MAG: dihydroneopterin aldolase [Rhodospirillaceae bacterium]